MVVGTTVSEIVVVGIVTAYPFATFKKLGRVSKNNICIGKNHQCKISTTVSLLFAGASQRVTLFKSP